MNNLLELLKKANVESLMECEDYMSELYKSLVEIRLKEIEDERDVLIELKDNELNVIFNATIETHQPYFDEYNEINSRYFKLLKPLTIEKSLLIIPKFTEYEDGGDVMTLSDFCDCVHAGGFIDSDGFGNYAKMIDGVLMESDVTLAPSTVKCYYLRTDMTHVVWYNK
jgi:hypothetical protein